MISRLQAMLNTMSAIGDDPVVLNYFVDGIDVLVDDITDEINEQAIPYVGEDEDTEGLISGNGNHNSGSGNSNTIQDGENNETTINNNTTTYDPDNPLPEGAQWVAIPYDESTYTYTLTETDPTTNYIPMWQCVPAGIPFFTDIHYENEFSITLRWINQPDTTLNFTGTINEASGAFKISCGPITVYSDHHWLTAIMPTNVDYFIDVQHPGVPKFWNTTQLFIP